MAWLSTTPRGKPCATLLLPLPGGCGYSSHCGSLQITGCTLASFLLRTTTMASNLTSGTPTVHSARFGGYGASFIAQVEPSANRFCLRCCESADDQQSCNSHQDRAGVPWRSQVSMTLGSLRSVVPS
ncbi:hypothetical protein OG21DRAFT_1126313 [Imleria badia]|nr:hypothetical protein OG21DRAFT_1126313 [Imleria badia]